ncbi:zinc finger domain-containing protein [Mycolicibacterium komossense]|uniref:DNA-binding phage zinc finger domain-containing protein n=1 Tax=Mycolicibacterium komossense TaxID=1779 RepID=A0ABT3CME7_9MYCO|nr:hypothetical protein [Mycolicibacterium komossense]MCV7230698.1 hypothetical protein [Mycolicibacterium komossense]
MRDDPQDLDYARGQQWHARQAHARSEWQRMRDQAVTVPCPIPPLGCGMPAGAACVTRTPGEPPKLLTRFPAHSARTALAKKLADQQRKEASNA